MKLQKWIACALVACLTVGGVSIATATAYNRDYLVEREPDTDEEDPPPPAMELDWVREMQAALDNELAEKAAQATPEELEKMGSFEVVLPPNFDFVIDPFEKSGRGMVFSEPMTLKNNGLGIVKITLLQLKADKSPPQNARVAREKNTEPLVVGYSAPLTIGESYESTISYQTEPPKPRPSQDLTIGASEDDLTIGASEDDLTIGASEDQAVQFAPPERTRFSSWDESITFLTDRIEHTLLQPDKLIQLLLRRLDVPDTAAANIPITPKEGKKIVFILHPGESASFDITGTLNPTPTEEWRPSDINITATYDVEVITAEQEALYLEEERLKELARLAKIEAAKKAAEEAANPKPKDDKIVDGEYLPPPPEKTNPNASYGTAED